MTSFNYLRSAHPDWLVRVLEFRIPERTQPALMALVAAAFVVGGAWLLDEHRLTEAHRIESAYREKFMTSRRALEKMNLYYAQVQTLVALDKRVQDIAASGQADAQRLADVANVLPQRAWLTEIAHDSGGMTINGRAENLRVLSDVLRSLIRTRGIRNPTLAQAHAVGTPNLKTLIEYTIHADAVR